MYEEYYGFARTPFSLSPDPRFLYRSDIHDLALHQVRQAIRRREGFIVLAGEIGTGKTTLCRTLAEEADATTLTALVLNPAISIEELLREMLLSFGVASQEAFRSGRLAAATKQELVRTLHEFLLSLVPLQASAVLIVDEAQHLSPDVLEEIRLLSNLETNDQKLLQIVLVGQLNLLDVLHDARLRQLNQRISMRCLLTPLEPRDVEAYVAHRLMVAEGSRSVVFTPEALALMHRISGGVPRVINLVCDRALMLGGEAETGTITDRMVLNAAGMVGVAAPAGALPAARGERTARRAVAIGLVLMLAALVVALLYAYGGRLNPFETERPHVDPPAAASLGVAGAASVPVPDAPPSLAPPPLSEGAFSVLVGTYDSPRDAAATERVLREGGHPVYAIDLAFPDGVRRRLLFVGRFRTRADAEAALTQIAPRFPNAWITLGATEPGARRAAPSVQPQ